MPVHGPVSLGSLEPRDFSFNSPQGACSTCGGLGVVQEIDPAQLIPDRSLSLRQGAVVVWTEGGKASRRYYDDMLASLAEHLGFSLDTPVRDLPPEALATLLYGSNGDVMPLRYHVSGKERSVMASFEGVIPSLRRRMNESKDDVEREEIARAMAPRTCPACAGARLRPEVRAVTVADKTISDLARMTVTEAIRWAVGFFDEGRPTNDEEPTANSQELASRAESSSLVVGPFGGTASALRPADPAPRQVQDPLVEGQGRRWSKREALIATPILKEVAARLRFLEDVGLGYLDLDRSAITLSGGETQRIRLATQVGAGLSGVLYVLDEPSIGLHPRDHDRLLATLLYLRDLGNSVLVVEHDEATIRAADWIIDIGPGAGEQGGELLASGPLEVIIAEPRSLTGQFLSGKRCILPPNRRRAR
jgi:excinuclease ABC subunit A